MPLTPDLEAILKKESKKFRIAEAQEKRLEKEGVTPQGMYDYFKTIGDPDFANYNDVSDVPLDYWQAKSDLEFKAQVSGAHDKIAASRLLSIVAQDYKAAYDLIQPDNLLSILDNLNPVDLDAPYNEIAKLHATYRGIKQLMEKGDHQKKLELHLKHYETKGGDVERVVKRFYNSHPEFLDRQLEEQVSLARKQLHAQFVDKDGKLLPEKLKEYVLQVVEKTPADEKPGAYFAIGKYAG